MRYRKFVRTLAQRVVERYDYSIVSNACLYDWQKPTARAQQEASPVPALGADTYLTKGNPRLQELEEAYAQLEGPITSPGAWTAEHVRTINLQCFRATLNYLYQRSGLNMNEMTFSLAYYYLKTMDRLGLFDRLSEDQAFGVSLSEMIEGRLVTRDLLDSVAELNFLERHLGISQRTGVSVLDIGAGYGRLAYRSLTALPSIERYLCTDAVAVSTFICEYYLRFRGVDSRAHVVPLHEIRKALGRQSVDLAINIYSFSECSVEAIVWWITLLRDHAVPHLMVVPNDVASDGITMLTYDCQDFSRVLTEFGYRLVARDPKYLDPIVQKYGPYPAVHFLFELQA
ncbi:MAG: putative sugar O-methyltransferase [Proteobacteria bacterium]|nr:putative sugar O-methyltransferase [Pseudomonadota bacterium]